MGAGAPQKRRIRAKIAPQPPKISTPKSHRPQIYMLRRAVRKNGARNVVGNEHEQRAGTDHFLRWLVQKIGIVISGSPEPLLCVKNNERLGSGVETGLSEANLTPWGTALSRPFKRGGKLNKL